MIKKTLILLSLILPLLGSAQSGVGTWQVFPAFRDVDRLIETPSKVYSLSTGSLMSYDMDNDETYDYGIHNKLTETGVVDILYNRYGKYLVVVYPSAGIDILYEDGRYISLPDIKDAILSNIPTITSISFAPGEILVATNFGYVIYDDKKMEVKESANLGTNVNAIGATSDYLVIAKEDTRKFYFAKRGTRIKSLDDFKSGDALCWKINRIEGLKGNKFIGEGNVDKTEAPFMFCVDSEEMPDIPVIGLKYGEQGMSNLRHSKDGFYMSSSDRIVTIDSEGQMEYYSLPEIFADQQIAIWDDHSRIWAGNVDGIAQYSLDPSGSVTVLHDKIKGNSLKCTKVGRLYVSPSEKIYISHNGRSVVHPDEWPYYELSYINTIKNGEIDDVTPDPVQQETYNIIEDPDDPSVYYISSRNKGVLKIKDKKIVTIYDHTNSTALGTNPGYYYDIDIDKKGNLYITNWTYGANGALIHMLPAEKRKSDTVSKEDWIKVFSEREKEFCGAWDNHLLVCKKSNIVLTSARHWEFIVMIDTKGTDTETDNNFKMFNSFVDQDGKEMTFVNVEDIGAFFEDSKGRVWVGYDKGIFIIPNPSAFNDANFRIQQIKVPRNDGTNYADYLLDGEHVLCITEDSQHRKWIGTKNSGVYLVNENGTEILQHFNTTNSLLPTNKVFAIACDPNSNAVYFGTVGGLVQYNSDTAPGSSDYSEVYAYPNPVRPEYTGWITVKGLMNDSLVKIADTAGNVFFEGKSNGGIITWDGCDASGNRVRTGVYYVFASNNDDGSSTGAVAKILVVR